MIPKKPEPSPPRTIKEPDYFGMFILISCLLMPLIILIMDLNLT